MRALILLALLAGAARGSVDDNRTPKERGHGNGNGDAPADIRDYIMIRGRNGQLTSWRDHLRMTHHGRVPAQPSSAFVCDECVTVLTKVRQLLSDGEFVQEVKLGLEMLCDNLPLAIEKEACKNAVEDIDPLVHKIVDELQNPRQVCTVLQLCGAQLARDKARLAALILVHINDKLDHRASDLLCDECVFVFTELKNMMDDKSAKQEAEQALEQLCSYLGGSVAQKCVSIVDSYFPMAWDELHALLADSRGLCVELQLCQGQRRAAAGGRAVAMLPLVPATRRRGQHSQHHQHQHHSRQHPQHGRLSSSVHLLRRLQTRDGVHAACALCQLGGDRLADQLADRPAAMSTLARGIRWHACGRQAPASRRAQCDRFLASWLEPALRRYLSDGELEADVCPVMELCKRRDLAHLARLDASAQSFMLCEACTLLAEFLQHELDTKEVQDEIVRYAEYACSQLEGDMKDECDQMVEQYLPAIFQSLVTELNPMKICPELGLCPARVAAEIAPAAKEAKEVDDVVFF